MDLSEKFQRRIDALPEDLRLQCLCKFKGGGYHKRTIQARFSNNQIIEMFEAMAENNIKDQTSYLFACHSFFIKNNKKTH